LPATGKAGLKGLAFAVDIPVVGSYILGVGSASEIDDVDYGVSLAVVKGSTEIGRRMEGRCASALDQVFDAGTVISDLAVRRAGGSSDDRVAGR